MERISTFQVPYPDFQNGNVMDESQFDMNNNAIQNKINEVVNLYNNIVDNGGGELPITSVPPFTATTVDEFIAQIVASLTSVNDGVSGADLIGSTTIAGLSGNSVQSQLEALKGMIDNVFTESEINTILESYYDSDSVDMLLSFKSAINHSHNDLYYTEAEVDAKIAEIVDSAPSTLNTLNELAQALGDDPNFATSISTLIGSKETPAGSQAKVDIVQNALNTHKISNDHDGRYYTESEVDALIAGVTVNSVDWAIIENIPATFTPSTHTHDDRYYTETEVDTKLANKASFAHLHSSITDSNVTSGVGSVSIYTCTQVEYDAIVSKDPSTLYIIK